MYLSEAKYTQHYTT